MPRGKVYFVKAGQKVRLQWGSLEQNSLQATTCRALCLVHESEAPYCKCDVESKGNIHFKNLESPRIQENEVVCASLIRKIVICRLRKIFKLEIEGLDACFERLCDFQV